MQKKIISIVIMLMLCVLSTAQAAVPYTDDFAQKLVKGANIMVGDSNGNMNLSSTLTRAEFAKIAVNTSPYKNYVALGAKISVFSDCTYLHWAAPYVKVAVTNNIITGYPDSTFRPDNEVVYEEAITVMLRLLGYTNEDFGNSWPYGQISLATNLGLVKNINKSAGQSLTREDALKLAYNTLNAKKKDSSTEYANSIDIVLHDNATIIATNSEDTSVSPGSVLTSAGTFTYTDSFLSEYVGTKGALAVRTNGEIVCFSPYTDNIDTYVVYSVLSNSVIVYKNGNLTELDVSDDTTVYYGAQKLTFSSAKSKLHTGDVIRVICNDFGDVHHMTLSLDSLKGPYTLSSYTSNWYNAFTNDAAGLSVVRNGEKVSTSGVKTNDILYYSKELNMVFAYAKTVVGIYENAKPNKDTPSTIVISGTEYEIESVEAFNKLSSNGSLSYGDSVTLLLGKDGKIADAVLSDTIDVSADVVGYLTECGKKSYENTDGENYTSYYVRVILADGTPCEYRTTQNYSSQINTVVKVSFNGENAKVAKASGASAPSGLIDADNMTIGRTPVSKDVKILDVSTSRSEYGGTAIRTYMQRLDGISIGSSSVLWCKRNAGGDIEEMILNDVTGDSSKYGIITDYSISQGSGSFSSSSASYTVDSDGTEYRYSGGIYSNLTLITPVKIVVSGNQVQSLSALSKISGKINGINFSHIQIGGIDYKLSDKVAVYVKNSLSNYSVMTLSDLINSWQDYSISVYTDKAEKSGGRIRVIIAQ